LLDPWWGLHLKVEMTSHSVNGHVSPWSSPCWLGLYQEESWKVTVPSPLVCLNRSLKGGGLVPDKDIIGLIKHMTQVRELRK